MNFFFRFGRILFKLARTFAVCREALFLPFFNACVDHLFDDNLETGKRNYCCGKCLELWIQKSVQVVFSFMKLKPIIPWIRGKDYSCHLPYFLRTFSEPKFRSATSIPRDFRRIPNHQDWRQETRVVHLRCGKKLLEFYKAPVTKFWSNVVSTLKVT